MSKSVFRFYLGLTLLLIAGGQAFGSQALPIQEQILLDYGKAKNFREFIDKLSRGTMPGEFAYVQQTWRAYPELFQDPSLPKLVYENKQFILRDGPSEVRLQEVEGEHWTFLVNGQKLKFELFDLPSQNMKKIMAATKSRKSAHFVLMPVVWAEGQGQPTKLDLIINEFINVMRDIQGLTQDEQEQGEADAKIMEAWSLSEKKGVSPKCLEQIEYLRVTLEKEKLPFSSLKCEGPENKTMNISLIGEDSEKNSYALDLNPQQLIIHQSARAFTFNHQSSTDTFAGATPADKAQIEYIYRFLGIAEKSDIRGLCKTCGDSLNKYTAKTQQAHEERRKRRETLAKPASSSK